MHDIRPFLEQLTVWVSDESAIAAALLVGSFARNAAREDSDIDLVLITSTPGRYLHDDEWLTRFGTIQQKTLEDWGLLQSIRVIYESGMEVEFGLTTPQWAAVSPVDEGTHSVVRDGAQILVDKTGLLATLLQAVHTACSDG